VSRVELVRCCSLRYNIHMGRGSSTEQANAILYGATPARSGSSGDSDSGRVSAETTMIIQAIQKTKDSPYTIGVDAYTIWTTLDSEGRLGLNDNPLFTPQQLQQKLEALEKQGLVKSFIRSLGGAESEDEYFSDYQLTEAGLAELV